VFFFLSKTLDLFLAPVTWALLLVLAGLLALWRKRPRLAAALVGAAALCLYAFSIEPVSNALERGVESSAVKTVRDTVTYDAAILLGGMVDVDASTASAARCYDDNVERLLAVFDLLRSGRARSAVISGGVHEPEGIPVVEASLLARQLEDWGISPARLVVDDRAINTRENALNVADIARVRGWKDLVMVTSAYHVRRALGCFNAVGLAVDVLPVDFRAYDPGVRSGSWLPRAASLFVSTSALREWFGRGVYAAKGWTAPELHAR
jgi:uncharacterized SAM-binding protein YcdF (DUF218 family)